MAKEDDRLLDGPAVEIEAVRKIPMLSPVLHRYARGEGDKQDKITKRERQYNIHAVTEAGDNERGNYEENSDSETVCNSFAVEKSDCANKEVTKEARIIIWSAADGEFLPVVKGDPDRFRH
jgi:hypothetical protein